MTIPTNPINNKPKDPYEGYKVEGVEKEKQAKEDQQRQEAPKPPPVLGGFLLHLFHRVVDFFAQRQSEPAPSADRQDVRENLLELIEALQTLKAEDRSQDPTYLHHLADVWNRAIEDNLTFKRASHFATAFRALFREWQNFPPNQEHTLGYYLTEFPGSEWLPFPYMEIIRSLHSEHQKNPAESQLTKWTIEVERLIGLLGTDFT